MLVHVLILRLHSLSLHDWHFRLEDMLADANRRGSEPTEAHPGQVRFLNTGSLELPPSV